jgi:hypothetical protein
LSTDIAFSFKLSIASTNYSAFGKREIQINIFWILSSAKNVLGLLESIVESTFTNGALLLSW